MISTKLYICIEIDKAKVRIVTISLLCPFTHTRNSFNSVVSTNLITFCILICMDIDKIWVWIVVKLHKFITELWPLTPLNIIRIN